NTVTSALIAVCSTNRAPSRATCSTASDRSPDEAKTSSISACSRSVGDTRGDMGVGPSSKTWQVLRGTYALVIYTVAGARPTGLLRQAGEQVPQVTPGVPQPPGLGGEPRQGLHDRRGDQLSVAQSRAGAYLRAVRRELRRFLQQVVGRHVQCGSEGVQVGVHGGLRVSTLG